MPADRKDLQARLVAATPRDTVRGVIFNAVFGVVRERVGPDAARACDPGGKATRTEFFSYPVVDFLRIIWNAADALAPEDAAPDEAFRAIGRRAAELVFETMVGRTLSALGGANSPRDLIPHVPAGYKATVSYGERRVSWPGERHARIVFHRDFLVPAFHCGVLAVIAERAGGRNVSVVGEQVGPVEAIYDVRWE